MLSFKDKQTEELWRKESSTRYSNVARVALRKLLQLQAAEKLADLAVPPGNRLEPLSGNRKGQHSIRINDQWRICFVWTSQGAENVEISDYH
ncbi:MAG: type II toxin-antitoxin system RelE/ParE family toxin [Verrucomicrobiota bacterium]